MSKRIQFISLVLTAVWMTGCENPKVQDAHLLTPDEVQIVESGVLMPGAGEVDYIEKLAAARDGYREALVNLITYYQSTGNAAKLQWARNELRTYEQMVHYQYLMPGEWAPEQLQATESIAEADELYAQAMSLFRQSGGLVLVTNEAKLRQALQLFNQVISDYPSSDKIDDAAYRAGRIYEHFRDYQLAAVFYQRTFQWNDQTRYPARFRAAYILDHRLRMRNEALALYKLAVEKEAVYQNNTEYALQRITQLSSPKSYEEPAEEPQIEGE